MLGPLGRQAETVGRKPASQSGHPLNAPERSTEAAHFKTAFAVNLGVASEGGTVTETSAKKSGGRRNCRNGAKIPELRLTGYIRGVLFGALGFARCRKRTPGPPPFSSMNSTPAASNAPRTDKSFGAVIDVS